MMCVCVGGCEHCVCVENESEGLPAVKALVCVNLCLGAL